MRTIFYHSFLILLVCWTICDAAAPSTSSVKSRSLIPFPRVGRSRLAAAQNQNNVQVTATNVNASPAARDRNSMREFKRHLIPFPRVGKRQSLIPFPRVGRSQQYLNYPADEVISEVGSVPDVGSAGLFLGSENEMVPVLDIQGLGDHPVYGQLRWQQGSQEIEE